MTFRLSSDGTEIGELVQTLARHPEGGYDFVSRLIPSGFLVSLVSGTIEERTRLELSGEQLRPLHYRFRRVGLGRDREVDIAFDWTAGRATNTVNGKAWQMELPADALDKHSLVLAVAADLAADALRDAYPVADGGKLKRYGHLERGREQVVTAAGSFATRVLLRQRLGKRVGTLFWHAEALDFLPVRIERKDGDGRRLLLELTGVQRGEQAAGSRDAAQ